ncbi:putative Ig domain-containing protein [Nitrospirota bacterium]
MALKRVITLLLFAFIAIILLIPATDAQAAAPDITTASQLPMGLFATSYATAITATGGVAPYTWSMTAGSLPPGMVFTGGISPSALIEGTPFAIGLYNFDVTVTGSNLESSTKSFTLNITDLQITNLNLVVGYEGYSYYSTMSAAGGTAPYTWSVVEGYLPDGLGLDINTGEISGTPLETGNWTFIIQVEDSAGINFSRIYIVLIANLSFTTPAVLPDATPGVYYEQNIETMGGTAPYSYFFMTGSLPPGISFNGVASSALINGTPTGPAGAYDFTVRVEDFSGLMQYREFVINIQDGGLEITTPSIPTINEGGPYSHTLTAVGGMPPYTWAIVNGNYLPSGLTLNPSTGEISGTAISGVSDWMYVEVIQVTDSLSNTATRGYEIKVKGLEIVPQKLQSAIKNVPYLGQLQGLGGTEPYSWAISSGALPSGLTLNSSTGEIAGTPLVTGKFTFNVTATDSAGVVGSMQYTLNVYVDLVFTSAEVLDAIYGEAYSFTVETSDEGVNHAWSIESGSLPPGLSLNPYTGEINGTPSAYGTYSFTLKAQTSYGTEFSSPYEITVGDVVITTPYPLAVGLYGASYAEAIKGTGGTAPYTWTHVGGTMPSGMEFIGGINSFGFVNSNVVEGYGIYSFKIEMRDSNGKTATKWFALRVQDIYIPTNSLSAGAIGSEYRQLMEASGGNVIYSWSIEEGSLPDGLSIHPVTGMISGVPTTFGEWFFVVRVMDSDGNRYEKLFSIEISSFGYETGESLPDATNGNYYEQEIKATGGTAPYSYSIIGGALPTGLNLINFVNPALINGIPSGTPGTYNITVRVQDSSGLALSRDFRIDLQGTGLKVTTTSLPDVTLGISYSQSITAADGTPPYSFSVSSGELPSGMSINPATGVLSGIPVALGSDSFTVKVEDSLSATAMRSYDINPEPVRITTISVPSPYYNTAYSHTLTAEGTAPFTWSVSGSLPPGLYLTPSIGHLNGTPLFTGEREFILTVVDANGTADSKVFKVEVDGVYIVAFELSDAESGAAYYETLIPNGNAPYIFTWSIVGGNIPTGLSLNSSTGEISGTPTVNGSYSFTVKLIDSRGSEYYRSYTIYVGDLVIKDANLYLGSYSEAYSHTFTGAGGTAPYTWSVTAGTIPTGLTLDSLTGQLSGTPSGIGEYRFTIQLQDSLVNITSREFRIMITDLNFSNFSPLPAGAINMPYWTLLEAVGGSSIYHWLDLGGLPPGLSIHPYTGTISGIPTSPGTYIFSVAVEDEGGDQFIAISAGFSITISDFQIVTGATLPAAINGAYYSEQIQVSGGSAPYSMSLVAGALPSGLVFQSGTPSGLINGTPVGSPGTYSFTLQFQDSLGLTMQREFILELLDNHFIDGVVFGEWNERLVGAEVKIKHTGGTVLSTTTNGSGYFSVVVPLTGVYKVKAKMTGHSFDVFYFDSNDLSESRIIKCKKGKH